MIHTFTITRAISTGQIRAADCFTDADINLLLQRKKNKITAQPYRYIGINEISIKKCGDIYRISVTVNPQSLIMQRNTISLYDCQPATLPTLIDQFREWMSTAQLIGLPVITEWIATRVDYAIDVNTNSVRHYVALAKAQNRPAWYFDRIDLPGSAYPESKSVTINFYDKEDQIQRKMVNVVDYSRLLGEAANIFRLEVQCRSVKLKGLQRKYQQRNDLRIANFLRRDIATDVIVGYYKSIMGYQDFHSQAHAEQTVNSHDGFGSAKKRNFLRYINRFTDFDTLHDAKRSFIEEHGNSSWYSLVRASRDANVNPLLIPDNWGVDYLPNPLPASLRI